MIARRTARVAARLALVLVAVTAIAGASAAAAAERRAEVRLAWLRLPGMEAPPRERALASLLAAVARRTAVATSGEPAPVVGVLDAALFEHPFVVLSGTGAVAPLDDEALDRLSTYLALGGMVLIDDASGEPDSAFSRSAREELSRATGGRDFAPLPDAHAISRAYYLLDRTWGRVDVSERLEAILLDGRAAVVHSRNDLAGAWARDAMGNWLVPVTPGGVRQREMAIRQGVNLVVYALTLDYKEDLVHVPLILERRR